LTNRRDVRSSRTLGDVLFLGSEVLAYSTSATRCSRVLTANELEVFALTFLRECNALVGLKVYDSAIKLEVMGRGKAFAFFSQELRLL